MCIRFAPLPRFDRAETRKVKNISANQFGDKLGRIHLGRQDLSSMKVTAKPVELRFSKTGGLAARVVATLFGVSMISALAKVATLFKGYASLSKGFLFNGPRWRH